MFWDCMKFGMGLGGAGGDVEEEVGGGIFGGGWPRFLMWVR